MRPLLPFFAFTLPSLGLLIAACGSLDGNTATAPPLATVNGSLTNPQSVGLSGPVRVAVVWRSVTPGEFNVAEDLPVQPVFPSSFTIQLGDPPPAGAMNSGILVNGAPVSTAPTQSGGSGGTPPPVVEAGAGSYTPPPDAAVATEDAGGSPSHPVPQDTPISTTSTTEFAIGSVVAYVDLNGNGKLDLVPVGASAYVDEIVAANPELALAYFEGPIPSGIAFVDAFGHLPVAGYNLLRVPACPPPSASPFANGPNPACVDAGAFDSGTGQCGQTQWLPISTAYTLTVTSSPEVSSAMCLSVDSSGLAGEGGGPGGPYDPSVQPASYPSPCDPNLYCSSDGSEYQYSTCMTVSKGICRGTLQSCSFLGYARPTPAPAGWPCVD